MPPGCRALQGGAGGLRARHLCFVARIHAMDSFLGPVQRFWTVTVTSPVLIA